MKVEMLILSKPGRVALQMREKVDRIELRQMEEAADFISVFLASCNAAWPGFIRTSFEKWLIEQELFNKSAKS